ncbi:MAG: alpha/beta hydrolase, partial [Candidatus Hydrogenedentes bacterium]|nr:alpha/beta hydrolase [Candidatus Hydrogenedentota bacterium]
LAPRLAVIRSPTIILHGAEDDLVPVSNVDYLRSHLPPDSIRQIRLFEGRNHLIPYSEPKAIREAIQEVAAGS